jgi:hypothetical protein
MDPRLLALASLALFALGCGGEPPPDIACQQFVTIPDAGMTADGLCAETRGTGSFTTPCPMGTTEVPACPTAGRTSRCRRTLVSGGITATFDTYSYGPTLPIATLQMQCDSIMGVFTVY